jgi:hypothetical protein
LAKAVAVEKEKNDGAPKQLIFEYNVVETIKMLGDVHDSDINSDDNINNNNTMKSDAELERKAVEQKEVDEDIAHGLTMGDKDKDSDRFNQNTGKAQHSACLEIASTEPKYHPCTKHLCIKWHRFRGKIWNGNIIVQAISTHDQLADAQTKPLQGDKFYSIVDRIMGWTREIE